MRENEVTFRITLYEIIGEAGHYFDITVKAFSMKSALEKARKVYGHASYQLAEIKVDAGKDPHCQCSESPSRDCPIHGDGN